MEDFKNISDDELTEYLDQIQIDNSAEERNVKKELLEILKSCRTKIISCENQMTEIIETVDKGKQLDIHNKMFQISKQLTKTIGKLNKVPFDYGIANTDIAENITVSIHKTVRFFREDDILRIQLPELLPHRPSYNAVNRKMEYFYDAGEWKASYMETFRKEFENGKFRIYNEKVVIVFKHHYDKKKKNHPDIDNLETKIIIDIITMFLLYDDSYEYVSHYSDGIEDNKDYTEIIICPKNKLAKYI